MNEVSTVERRDRRARHYRRLYWAQNLVWVWIGAAVIFSGMQFFLAPESVVKTAIGHQLSSHIDDVWNACFIASGVLLIVGVLSRRSRVEMVGHWLFNAGIVPDALAVLIVAGGGPSFWLTAGLGFGSLGRLYFLTQTTRRRGHP